MYGWQEEAVGAWLSRGHGVIVAPTGSGKTRVALEAIKRLGRFPVLFIVPTNVLVRQHSKTLRGHGLCVGVWNGAEKSVGRHVTLTTYSSAYRHWQRLLGVHEVLVFDEVHHAFAERWVAILGRFLAMGRRHWMGLTATPEGVPPGMVTYICPIDRARREGAISGLDLHVVTVDIPVERRLEYRYIVRQIERLRTMLAVVVDEAARKVILKRLAIWNQRLRMLLDVTVEKEMVIADIVRRNGVDRAIAFVEAVRHAEALAMGLRARGLRAMAYHSGMSRGAREAVMEAWRRSGGVLVAVKALDEGIDVPECKHIFILSCPKRFRRAVQRIGRGLRPGEKLQLYVVETIGMETGGAKAIAAKIAEKCNT